MYNKQLLSLLILTILFITGCDAQESVTKPVSSDLVVHYIDVGQADATLLQFTDQGEEYTVLIDAGDFSGNEVVDYLKSKEITTLDIAIGTHPDADHIGQLDKVINEFAVGEVWLSGNTGNSRVFQRVLEAINTLDIGYEEPRTGDEYEVGPLKIEVLHPKEISGKSNEESLSLKMTYGHIRFIFTGDAYVENELEMIKSGADLQADILHLGHHGSSTSTSEEFLQAVNPKVAIYSAGENNSYGHPHREIVSLVQEANIELYGTDVHGTIIVTTDGENYTITTAKEGTVTPSIAPTTKKEEASAVPTTPKNNSSCIDINTASAEELEKIIHIGPEYAQDLIELRPFQSVEQLTRINGIGKGRIKDILAENLACVGG